MRDGRLVPANVRNHITDLLDFHLRPLRPAAPTALILFLHGHLRFPVDLEQALYLPGVQHLRHRRLQRGLLTLLPAASLHRRGQLTQFFLGTLQTLLQ
jgi:hypothetical protein